MSFLAFPRPTQSLPFTVTFPSTPDQLGQVLALRQDGFSRHRYPWGETGVLLKPDAVDLGDSSVTLVAVDKEDGRVVGTLRMVSSLTEPIAWAQAMPEDECLQGAVLYISRFAVSTKPEHAMLVASAMMKAVWLWARGMEIEWGVALARDALVRIYRHRIGMEVRGGGQVVYQPGDDRPEGYSLLGVRPSEVPKRIEHINPRHYNEFFSKRHPDIRMAGGHLPWSNAPAVKVALPAEA